MIRAHGSRSLSAAAPASSFLICSAVKYSDVLVVSVLSSVVVDDLAAKSVLLDGDEVVVLD